MKTWKKDLIKATSLANLCFLQAWSDLISWYETLQNLSNLFYLKYPPSSLNFIAIIVNVILLAIVFWTAMSLARHSDLSLFLGLVKCIILLGLLIPLNYIRINIPALHLYKLYNSLGLAILCIVGFLLLIGFLILFKGSHKKIFGTASAILLILSPLTFITFSQAIWAAYKVKTIKIPLEAKQPYSPKLNSNDTGIRFLWILFDEMDQRLSFLDRPSSINLPEFDKLRNEAIYATHAYPPAGCTDLSLPALLTGKPVYKSQQGGLKSLKIPSRFHEFSADFGSLSTVFSDARANGYRTASAGWALPLCRVIKNSLSFCYWEEDFVSGAWSLAGANLLTAMHLHFIKLLETIPLFTRYGLVNHYHYNLREHIVALDKILNKGKEYILNREIGFIFLHLPIPHGPDIYDPITNNFSLSSSSTCEYIDNLELSDRVLGELRREMEVSGVWDNSVILVSSDHWWRNYWKIYHEIDQRIPFLLKLPKQMRGIQYDAVFNTVITRDLISDLFSGKISEPEDVVKWLDRHRTFYESPYDCGNK
jgi:hypothetical protein